MHTPSRQSRLSQLLSCIVIVLGLIAPQGEAKALAMQIDFDFTLESSLSLLGGTIVTPPDGSFDLGVMRLHVEATDLTTPTPGGDVSLMQSEFSGTVAKNVAGAADISGPYSGTQVGVLNGTLAPGETSADFIDDIFFDLNIVLGCLGAGCDPLGFPVSVVGVTALSFSSIPISGLDALGLARIELITPVELDGVLGVLTLIGNETSRAMVPEPQTAALLLMGLALLGRRSRTVRLQ